MLCRERDISRDMCECTLLSWQVTTAVPFSTCIWVGRRCRDDPDYADAIRIETALGIPVLRHDEKKPGGIDEVLAFFEGKDPDGGTVSGDAFRLHIILVWK